MNSSIRPKRKISEYGLVIVTGGSSGLGKTIIERVVNLGSRPKLCNLSRQKPKAFFNDEIDLHLECDLSQKKERSIAFDALDAWINSLGDTGPILLINNAGIGLYGPTPKLSTQNQLDLIEVNISAVIELTQKMLPHLLASGGTIMNIASTAAFQATPGAAVYGASKAFILNWTLSLDHELKSTPVNAMAVCPGPTRTQFFERAGVPIHSIPASTLQTAEQVVDASFKALAKGKAYVIPSLLNKISAQISFRLPKSIGTAISGRIIQSIRKPNQ